MSTEIATLGKLPPLSSRERADFETYKQIIKSGTRNWLKVTEAYLNIERLGLWREDYPSMLAFRQAEYPTLHTALGKLISAPRRLQMAKAVQVMQEVEKVAPQLPLIATESHAKALEVLPTPEAKAEVYQAVLKREKKLTAPLLAKEATEWQERREAQAEVLFEGREEVKPTIGRPKKPEYRSYITNAQWDERKRTLFFTIVWPAVPNRNRPEKRADCFLTAEEMRRAGVPLKP